MAKRFRHYRHQTTSSTAQSEPDRSTAERTAVHRDSAGDLAVRRDIIKTLSLTAVLVAVIIIGGWLNYRLHWTLTLADWLFRTVGQIVAR